MRSLEFRIMCKADSGTTLVELTISMVILTIVTVIALGVFASANMSFDTLWGDTGVNMCARTSLDALCRDLRAADSNHIFVDTTDPNWDAIRLQVPVAYSSGAITWGANGTPGHFLVYTVTVQPTASPPCGVLSCQQVDNLFNPVGPPRILANDIDVLRSGQKGFIVQSNGGLYTFELRARVPGRGPERFRTASSGVILRNG